MNNHTGKIKEIKEINRDIYCVKIFVPKLKDIQPGQYISILCKGLTFRRPFSVADFENNTITILIKKRGKGTELITNLKSEDTLELSAPLGNKFSIENKKTLLVGAGIGVAPLIYLNKKLKNLGSKTFFAAGFQSKSDIIEIVPYDFISTDDGTNKNIGSICDYLEEIIKDFLPDKIVSCAPRPVLKIVAETAEKYDIQCDVCMEKVMACGIGVCRGCAIKIKQGDEIVNKTVCKDGPVFNGMEVIW